MLVEKKVRHGESKDVSSKCSRGQFGGDDVSGFAFGLRNLTGECY